LIAIINYIICLVCNLPSLSLALSSSFSSALKAAALVLELAPVAADLAETMLKMKTLAETHLCSKSEAFYRTVAKNIVQKDLQILECIKFDKILLISP
jgi:nitrogenase subunit NifH